MCAVCCVSRMALPSLRIASIRSRSLTGGSGDVVACMGAPVWLTRKTLNPLWDCRPRAARAATGHVLRFARGTPVPSGAGYYAGGTPLLCFGELHPMTSHRRLTRLVKQGRIARRALVRSPLLHEEEVAM